MAGRKQENETLGARERLVAAAYDLFHAKGVAATSVDEILACSGTGKSQFYHYFGSKDGIIQAVVDAFGTRFEKGDLPACVPLRSLEDLESWFEVFLGFQRSTGCVRHCPMATIASGLDASQEEIRLSIDKIFLLGRARLEGFFTEAISTGKLVPEQDPVALADFCFTIMQGGLLLSRIRKDVTPFENAVRHALAHVRSLMT